MTLIAEFTVPGKPVPKPRAKYNPRTRTTYYPKPKHGESIESYERRVQGEAFSASRWVRVPDSNKLERRSDRWPQRGDCARERPTRRAGKSKDCACAFCASRIEVELRIYVPDRRHRDLDNIAKSILDGMNRVLFQDDSQVLHTTIDKALDRANPRVEVVVRLTPPAQRKLDLEEPDVDLETCPECEGAGVFAVTLPVSGKKREVVCGPCRGSGKVSA